MSLKNYSISEYRINIDRAWTLNEFSILTRSFERTYSLLHIMYLAHVQRDEFVPISLKIAEVLNEEQGRPQVLNIYRAYSGFRVNVRKFQYASPGVIEISVILAAAFFAEKLIRKIADSINHIEDARHKIAKNMHEKNLWALEEKRKRLKLTKDQLKFLQKESKKLAGDLGFTNIENLERVCPDPLMRLHLLLQFSREAEILARFIKENKVNLQKKPENYGDL